jgi:hypothetical protein
MIEARKKGKSINIVKGTQYYGLFPVIYIEVSKKSVYLQRILRAITDLLMRKRLFFLLIIALPLMVSAGDAVVDGIKYTQDETNMTAKAEVPH